MSVCVHACTHTCTYVLAEGPVVGGVGEGVRGPLLEQAAGHHVHLDVLEYVPQHLVTGLTPPRLHRRQPLVVARDRCVMLHTPLVTPLRQDTW